MVNAQNVSIKIWKIDKRFWKPNSVRCLNRCEMRYDENKLRSTSYEKVEEFFFPDNVKLIFHEKKNTWDVEKICI